MRTQENYTPLLTTALLFTLAILVAFQIYLLREPARVFADTQHDRAQAVEAGRVLFAKSCATCHGSDGAGDVGPALNDKQFLNNTADGVIFSLISSGVPGSEMPAWNQAHGGPLTDEDVSQLVAFIRAWEPSAPDRHTAAVGDAARGEVIFNSVCFICHGTNGAGTDRAPALNDPLLLSQFDDAWFHDTISAGRPAQGMPTWGTVLSPQQITDVLALIDQWRTTAGVVAPAAVPAATATAQP
jgi:cbb3-type cytochrome c oxidase subunit III